MWAGASGAHGGEAVVMPFAFRRSGALNGCHDRGSDEAAQGVGRSFWDIVFYFASDGVTQAV